jgi:hypothetical protein
MTHITDDQLYLHAFDQTPLAGDEAAHLAACRACQQQLTQLQTLQHEFDVARRSQPTSSALHRYESLFDQVPKPVGLLGLLQRLTARLVWDSRQQPALGVRTPVQRAYRLFYATDQVELDVMITPRADRIDLDGEVIPSDTHEVRLPLLLIFENAADPNLVYRGESTLRGRFHIEGLMPGQYHLWITPSTGRMFALEGLMLT